MEPHEINFQPEKVQAQADRKSNKFSSDNEIYRKTMEKKTKKDNVKLATMTVPIINTELNSDDFMYWEDHVLTYDS